MKTKWMLIVSLLFSAHVLANPEIRLQTSSLGYPYNQDFTITVAVSEAVTDFTSATLILKNVKLISLNGSGENYQLQMQAIKPGVVIVTIPAHTVHNAEGLPNTTAAQINLLALDPKMNPATNFNLMKWSLRLPTPLGGKDNATLIAPKILNGDPTKNTGFTQAPYFYTDQNTGAMNFWGPINGATTENSDYPRSELREVTPVWLIGTYSENSLTASLQIKEVPNSKKVCIGQIHGQGDTDAGGNAVIPLPLVKLIYSQDKMRPNQEYCNGCIYAEVRPTPSTADEQMQKIIVADVPLSAFIHYKISLQKDGTLQITVNGKQYAYMVNMDKSNLIGWGSQHLYFKAGVYVLDSGQSSQVGGGTAFYYLNAKHRL